jgi:hypothetical protein
LQYKTTCYSAREGSFVLRKNVIFLTGDARTSFFKKSGHKKTLYMKASEMGYVAMPKPEVLRDIARHIAVKGYSFVA